MLSTLPTKKQLLINVYASKRQVNSIYYPLKCCFAYDGYEQYAIVQHEDWRDCFQFTPINGCKVFDRELPNNPRFFEIGSIFSKENKHSVEIDGTTYPIRLV